MDDTTAFKGVFFAGLGNLRPKDTDTGGEVGFAATDGEEGH